MSDRPPWRQPDTVASELREIATPTLFVNVDFNNLLDDFTEEKAFEIVGKLKDLLA